jgi:general secretion pathway protein E
MEHRLIGDILMECSNLQKEALEQALKVQEERGGRIGEILIDRKNLTEKDLLKGLGQQFDLPFQSDLSLDGLNTNFTQQIPIQFLKKYKMIPVEAKGRSFIAINDPLSFQPLDDLRLTLGLNGVPIVLAPNQAIVSAINMAYEIGRDSAEDVIEGMHGEEDSALIMSEIEETGDLLDETSDAPIIRLVNLMLSQAVKARASDIHVEPYQHELKIRYRIDGILYDRALRRRSTSNPHLSPGSRSWPN